jgi:hypothetical protein
VIFEEDGGPGVCVMDDGLRAVYCIFELRECVGVRGGLEFVGPLADIYYVLCLYEYIWEG